jgi:hypothetical protein
LSALRPWNAAHVLSATTATPELICTTLRTPGTFSAALASYDATFPPICRGFSTEAYFIPGTFTSIPYVARPFVFGVRSSRLRRVPTIVN